MPTPRRDESMDDFLGRCIPQVLEEGTAKSQEQAVAVCSSMWRNRNNTRLMAIDHQRKRRRRTPY